MMVRWSGEVQVNVSGMSGSLKPQSELDIGGRETCMSMPVLAGKIGERENQLNAYTKVPNMFTARNSFFLLLILLGQMSYVCVIV